MAGRQNQKPTQDPSRALAECAPRLPYHPAIEERFGISAAEWKPLVEAIFPLAQSMNSVVLALSYCKARRLDPFKRCVHIVPMWNSGAGRMLDTIWPGIGELRTTAFRTGQYAGRDKTEFGPDVTKEWTLADKSKVTVTFPEWAQVTVYRMISGQKVAFSGPQVFWLETYSKQSHKETAPNSMWNTRPRGQLGKCAEAASLRAAFPEELGNELCVDEMAGKTIDGESTPVNQGQGSDALLDRLDGPKGIDSVDSTESESQESDETTADASSELDGDTIGAGSNADAKSGLFDGGDSNYYEGGN